MVPFLRRHSNAASRRRLTISDARPSGARTGEPSDRIRNLLGDLLLSVRQAFSARIQLIGQLKRSTLPPSPSTPIMELFDFLEDVVQNEIADDMARLVRQSNLIRPISTAGLIYAENVKDGLVTYEGMEGEGFVRWLNEGLPHYEELVGQDQADMERKKFALLRRGNLEGARSSMGNLRNAAEKWDLEEIKVPKYPEAIWTGGVTEVRSRKNEGAGDGSLGDDRPAWARLVQREVPLRVTEVERQDEPAMRGETPTRQIGFARERPMVATEKEKKVYCEEEPEDLSEEDALSEEVLVSAEVDGFQHWDMKQYMSMADKADFSDDDSDYVSWTLEDEWELNSRLEEMGQ